MSRRFSAILPAVMLSALFGTAAAYTVEGTVNDSDGKAVSGASVALLKEGKSTTTDASGKFVIYEAEPVVEPVDTASQPGIDAIRGAHAGVGFFNLDHGVLSFSQGGSAPVTVKVFDLMGNQIASRKMQGSGVFDLGASIDAQGTYLARVQMGSAQQTFRFTAAGNYSGSIAYQEKAKAALKAAAAGESLQVIADGYDTLNVPLSSLDTTLNLKLTKTAPVVVINGVYDYVKGNAPAPSRGCGKNSSLVKTKSVENGDRFEMSVAGLNREYFITLPKNYDNTKPHKLLFAMHCMGSNAEDFVHHTPDQDHPSPYYGQQKLDTEGNYIFVAPRGDTDGMPWRGGDDKDHQFFDKLLTTMEENYCIDTSRVFVTGFSFGSMFTNSLAQAFQHRVRAAVTYAVADWNIYIPTNKGKPIAWMDVHGTDDGLCDYKRLNSSITRILKNNGPGGTDVSDEVNVMKKHSGNNGEPHVCYDFQKVDPNHPVRVCTWKGGHQWTANDNGGWQNTWVPEDVHKFLEQF